MLRRISVLAIQISCLLAPLSAIANTIADGSVSLNSNDNIPNAKGDGNVFSDYYGEANFSLGKLYTPSVGKNILLLAEVDSRSYHHTSGLNQLAIGGVLSYTQRLGLGAYAPRINFFVAAKQHNYREDIRDGWVYSTGFGIEKRFTPAVRIEAGFKYEDRHGDENNAEEYHPGFNRDVFSQQNQEVTGAFEYTFENYSSLTFRYRYRDGEADTSTHPGSTLLNFSKAIAWDPGIADDYVVYLINSSSQTFAIDWSYPLGDDSAIGVSYEKRIAKADGNNTYRSNILSAQFTLRF